MVLLFGLGIVLYIRKKVPLNTNSLGKTQKSPWLFESTKQPNELSFAINPTDQNFSNEATIRFQKNIDAKNSVIMLDFLDQSYLVLMGENNLLLDKFTDNKPSSQNEFDIMLEHRYKQLDNFLNSDTKSALDSYKQKASNTLYDS